MTLRESDLSSDQLWSLLELATEGVWLWNIVDDEVSWSPMLLKTLGYDTPPDRRLDVLELTHPDNRDAHREAIDRHLEENRPYNVEIRMRRAGGDYHWFLARGLTERNAAGEPLRMLGYLVSTENFKIAETRLAENEARFRAFMDNSPAGVWIKDENSRHLYANPAAAAITGAGRETIIGSRTDEIFPPETAAFLAEADKRVLQNDEIHRWTGELALRDGTRKFVHDVRFRIRLGDGREAVAGFGLDLSELKESQDTLEAVNRLESIGRLAGGIAHDFNNMLGVILGFSELALTHLDESHPAAKHINGVLEAARRSAAITRQLLGYARKQSNQPRRLDIRREVERDLQLLEQVIGRNIDVRLTADDGLWRVHLDPGQLDQIISNLCINARDAIGQQPGRIDIRLENVVLDEHAVDDKIQQPGEYVRMTVTDDGCGMTEEVRDKLFEPFFSTKDASLGTGLGLATVYGIVRQNGGNIRVVSEPGHGTTFLIDFPRDATGLTGTTWKHPVGHHDGKGRSLLVVEDEPRLLDVLRDMLAGLNYRVTAVASAAAARRAFEQQPFEVLVSDMMLGQDSGSELATELARRAPELRVLLISGRRIPDGKPAAGVARRPHFVQKPFSTDTLAAALEALLTD